MNIRSPKYIHTYAIYSIYRRFYSIIAEASRFGAPDRLPMTFPIHPLTLVLATRIDGRTVAMPLSHTPLTGIKALCTEKVLRNEEPKSYKSS